MPQLTKDDFDNWWGSPVGEAFRQMVKENLDKLAYGGCTDAMCRDSIANAERVGQYQANLFFHNLQYEDIVGSQ